MSVDSFAFLPRSLRPLYEDPELPPGESGRPFTPLEAPLSQTTVMLATSAGAYVDGEQEPFDLDRERREPTWGDPSHRMIPHDTSPDRLDWAHLHISLDDLRKDRNVALPIDVLDGLETDGLVGGTAGQHLSVMGYQGVGDDPLAGWRDRRGELLDAVTANQADGMILAPV